MYRRILVTALIGAFGLLAVAGPAPAGECPKLIKQIADTTGNRLDAASYDAKQKAAQAQKLHDDKKHADSVKAAKEALALLGIK